MLSLRQLKKINLEPWGFGPVAASQYACPVPQRDSESSPALHMLCAPQNKAAAMTGGCCTPLCRHIRKFFLWKLWAQFFSTGDPGWYTACNSHNTAHQLEKEMRKKVQYRWYLAAWFNIYSPRNPNKSWFPTASFPWGEYHIIYLGGQRGNTQFVI